MLVFFLLLVIVAMALGILGIVVKGLFYLLFTGIGVLLIAFLLGALWMRRRRAGATPGNSLGPPLMQVLADGDDVPPALLDTRT